MGSYEYVMNKLYEKDIDSTVNSINNEVRCLKKIKTNITRFAYSEAIKGKIIFLDFQRCMSEVERIAIEVEFLEARKLEYLKFKES